MICQIQDRASAQVHHGLAVKRGTLCAMPVGVTGSVTLAAM
jgi:hypothetical protein